VCQVKALDLVGQVFGRLTVIYRAENDAAGGTRWLCRCDCGGESVVAGGNLRSGHTASCGCSQQVAAVAVNTTHGQTANGVESPEYKSWGSMWTRVQNPRRDDSHRYGGRGITVATRWRDFSAFLGEMGPRPAGTSLDRIDNSQGYSAANCRWATPSTQSRNSRQAKLTKDDAAEIWALYATGGSTPTRQDCRYGVAFFK
jgi:hypothetical protein